MRDKKMSIQKLIFFLKNSKMFPTLPYPSDIGRRARKNKHKTRIHWLAIISKSSSKSSCLLLYCKHQKFRKNSDHSLELKKCHLILVDISNEKKGKPSQVKYILIDKMNRNTFLHQLRTAHTVLIFYSFLGYDLDTREIHLESCSFHSEIEPKCTIRIFASETNQWKDVRKMEHPSGQEWKKWQKVLRSKSVIPSRAFPVEEDEQHFHNHTDEEMCKNAWEL